jgi:hypothetical protein
MKNLSLAIGVAVIGLANVFALIHAAHNRMGRPDAELTLTKRELTFSPSASDDNSGVTLHLQWTTLGDVLSLYGNASPKWLDREKLQALGFDCSLSPTAENAQRFYQRQRPRQTFVALEYDGPAWRAWQDAYRTAQQQAQIGSNARDSFGTESRLVPIDADSNAATLRTRYLDRSSVLIVPAVVSMALVPYVSPGENPVASRARRLEGRIQEIASLIHVPRPFSNEFPRRTDRPYSVHLRYGTLLEPWVTGVEFSKP